MPLLRRLKGLNRAASRNWKTAAKPRTIAAVNELLHEPRFSRRTGYRSPVSLLLFAAQIHHRIGH
jgi:hypothetical protein